MHLPDDDKTLLTTGPILPSRGVYLSVDPRETVFAGQIDQIVIKDQVTGGNIGVVYYNSVGDYADIEADMSIDFGTTIGGREIGTTRVRRKDTTSDLLFIAETAQPDLKLQPDQYFTVKREWFPRLVKPRGVGAQVNASYTNQLTLFMDYETPYTDQNVLITPKANITRDASLRFSPRPAAFVDGFWTASPQIYRTITLSGFFSIGWSAAITEWHWDVRDGTITVGDADSRDITVQFPVGFRWIRLTVVDGNGKIGLMYWPIWVHSADSLPLSQFKRTRDSTLDWREVDLLFYKQSAAEVTIPKGTALCQWKETRFTTVPEQYRSHMLGWCKTDTTLFRRYMPTTQLTIMGAAGWLNAYRGFPMRVSDPITRDPNTWFELSDITLDALAYYVLDNVTTVTRMCNYYASAQLDDLKSLDITQGNVWQQLNYILSGYWGKIKSDSLNALWSNRYYVFCTDAEKADFDTTMSLNRSHWTDANPPSINRNYTNPVGHILGGGASFDGAANTLWGAYAPAIVPADFDGDQTAPFQNLPNSDPQGELLRSLGIYYGYLNDPRKAIPIKLLYDLDVFEPAWNEPIAVTTTDSNSGRTMTDEQFMITGIDIQYGDPRTERETQITLTVEGVSTGDLAFPYAVEADPVNPVDDLPPVDIPIPPVVVPSVSPIPGQTGVLPISGFVLAAAGAQAALAVSYSPTTGVINYHEISTGLTGGGVWATSDPFNYFRHFVLTADGLFRCDDVSAFSTWTLVRNNASLFGNSSYIGHQIIASHLRRGWFMILAGDNMAVVTFDYFVTIHLVSINGAGASFSGFGNIKSDSAWICGHDVNHIYAIAPSVADSGNTTGMYHSTDGGLTWTLFYRLNASDNPFDGYYNERSRQVIEIPYTRSNGTTPNTDDASLEIWMWSAGDLHHSLANTIYSSLNRGLSWALAQYGTEYSGSAGNVSANHPMTSYTNNSSYAAWLDGTFVRRSTDHLTSQSSSLLTIGSEGDTNLNGWPPNPNALICFSRRSGEDLKITINGGGTWFGTSPAFFSDKATAYAEFNLYTVQPARG